MRKLIFSSMTYPLCMFGFTCILTGATLLAQEENRAVSGFNKISYSLSGDLEIVQGTTEALILKGDKDDMSKIITKVEDGVLKIYCKEHSNNLGDVEVFVSLKNLKELSVAGSGDVVFKTGLKTTEMEINLSGSGNIECLELDVSEAEINLAGSGNILLGGTLTNNEVINIVGSGNVDAEQLQTKESEVNISGSGSAKVWATDKLESNIVGSGDVYYKGRPLVDANTSGSGSTKPM